jgi:hypothetical protein
MPAGSQIDPHQLAGVLENHLQIDPTPIQGQIMINLGRPAADNCHCFSTASWLKKSQSLNYLANLNCLIETVEPL